MTHTTDTKPILHGHAQHRRTQSDYLRAILDRVTLETWGEVIEATVTRAKAGDTQARAFLAAYLVGKPATDAPTPLAVMAQIISGNDPLVHELARPAIDRIKFPILPFEDDREAAIETQVAAELSAHIESEA